MKKLLFPILGVILMACSKSVETHEPQPIMPLYRVVAEYQSMDSAWRDSVLVADSAALRGMFQILGVDTLDSRVMNDWSRSLAVDRFTPPVDSVFPSLTGLEDTLGIILARADAQGLDLPRREYVAVVWGNRLSLVFNGDILYIAMNHYLGANHAVYDGWPLYLKFDKNPGRLPYDLAEALVADKYPYERADNATALSRMIYEGVLTVAKMTLVPDARTADALGYNQGEMDFLKENEQEIWHQMVAKKLVYDPSEATANKLVAPAPTTAIITPTTPRRVGRYIGYRIVTEYMRRHKEVSLRDMLKPAFYNDESVLIESQFGS